MTSTAPRSVVGEHLIDDRRRRRQVVHCLEQGRDAGLVSRRALRTSSSDEVPDTISVSSA